MIGRELMSEPKSTIHGMEIESFLLSYARTNDLSNLEIKEILQLIIKDIELSA